MKFRIIQKSDRFYIESQSAGEVLWYKQTIGPNDYPSHMPTDQNLTEHYIHNSFPTLEMAQRAMDKRIAKARLDKMAPIVIQEVEV